MNWSDSAAVVAREAARPTPPPHRRGVALTLPLAMLWPLVVALAVLVWGPR